MKHLANIVMIRVMLGFLLNFIPYAVLCYIPFHSSFRMSAKKQYGVSLLTIGIGAAIYGLALSLYPGGAAYYVGVLGFTVICFVMYWLTVQEPVSKLFFVFFVVMSYGTFISNCVMFAETRLYPETFSQMYSWGNSFLMLVVLGITMPLMGLLLSKLIKPTHGTVKREIWSQIAVLPIMFTFALLFCSGLMNYEKIAHPTYLIINCVLACVGFIVYYVAIQMIVQTSVNVKLEENIGIIERQITLQAEQYAMLSWQIEQTRAAQHDMRQHAAALTGLATQEDIQGIKVYLGKMGANIPRLSDYLYCENLAVNAMIHYYMAICKQEHISFKVNLHIGRKLSIPDNLLCVLLGNLLENAVEACRRIENGERFVSISAAMTRSILGINVDNSFDGKICKKQEIYLSSKRQNCEGIGISSIRSIAEKYGNGVVFSHKEKVFKATVLLHAQ